MGQQQHSDATNLHVWWDQMHPLRKEIEIFQLWLLVWLRCIQTRTSDLFQSKNIQEEKQKKKDEKYNI